MFSAISTFLGRQKVVKKLLKSYSKWLTNDHFLKLFWSYTKIKKTAVFRFFLRLFLRLEKAWFTYIYICMFLEGSASTAAGEFSTLPFLQTSYPYRCRSKRQRSRIGMRFPSSATAIPPLPFSQTLYPLAPPKLRKLIPPTALPVTWVAMEREAEER